MLSSPCTKPSTRVADCRSYVHICDASDKTIFEHEAHIGTQPRMLDHHLDGYYCCVASMCPQRTIVTTVEIKPTRMAKALLCATLMIFAIIVARTVLVYAFDRPTLFGFAQMLDPDKEANLISWYSSSLLLIASLMLGLIAADARRACTGWARHWVMLAGVFLFLSADEACCIHEMMGDSMHAVLPTGGFLRYAWVIPWGTMAVIVGMVSGCLLCSLPRQIRSLVVIGAIIYVGGAIGVEMHTGKYMTGRTEADLAYSMMVNIEEFMEMLGVVILIHALGLLMESRTAGSFSEPTQAPLP